jgi:chitinase
MIRKFFNWLCFLFIGFQVAYSQPNHNKKVVGYYAQWAIYARDFNIGKIDGNKLTHLMYAFFNTEYSAASPQTTKLKSLDSYADFEHTENGGAWPPAPWDSPVKGNFYDLKKLKEKYPHLKILISLGGWTKSQNLPYIAADPIARTALANDMAAFLVTYPFIDGFDIDWEFPMVGGIDGTEVIGGITPPAQPHTPNDNKNLVYLLKAMRQAMPSKQISMAAGNNVVNVPIQFIGPGNKAQYGMIEDITTFCDFITFFGYDFGGNWYDKTCHNAPLYGSGNTNDPLNANNESLDNLTNIYLNNLAIPSNKLVMGIPFYGKIFDRVANSGTIPSLPGLFVAAPRTTGSCVNPQAPQGTWDSALCEYSGSIEFCDLAGSAGTTGHHFLDPANPLNVIGASWTRYWDNTAKVPYLYNSSTKQFITYDDKQSIDGKAKYISAKNLGGAMIWELSQDTRPGSAEPAALLGQINTSFSSVTPPPPTGVNVKVTFKDPTNAAIAGVIAILKKTSDNTTVTTTSDASGVAQFPNTTTNLAYTISYTKNLYTFLPQSIVIASGALTSDAMYNVTGSTQSIPTYTISGTVKNGSTGIVGVTVALSSNGVNTTSVTNANGTYSFANLTAGQNYVVTPSNSGQTFSPVSSSFSNLNANQTQDFNLVINSTYLISGTVKNGNSPVAGAKVNLVLPWTNDAHGWVELATVSDAQGNYHFENAVLSGYTTYLSFKLNAWENNNVTYLPALGQGSLPTTPQLFNFNTQTVVVPTTPVVVITAPTTPTLAIDLGISIAFVATAGLSANDGTTISSVVFKIDELNIAYSGSGSYTANWTPVANQFGVSHTLTVTATASNGTTDTKTYTFTLNCSGVNCPGQPVSISGSVKNGATLVANVTVKLLDTNNVVLSTITSTDGNFSFANLANGGTFKVTAEKSGYTFTPTTLTNVTTNQTGVVVNGTANLVFYSISGVVKNGATGISGVTVALSSNGTNTTSVTSANGSYSFANLASGQNYVVTPSSTGQSFTPGSATFNALSANQTQDFSLVITSTYLISGTVKNGNTPVGGAKLELVLPWTDNTHNWVALTTLTDAQGNYHFENSVISGYTTYLSFKLNAWENNNVTYLPALGQGSLPTAPKVFNFNTQAVVNTTPVVTITAPTATSISLNPGSAYSLSASVGLSNADATTISSVVFAIDGQSVASTGSSGNYTASWTPVTSQFGASHTLTVTATASNGTTDVKTTTFTLNCSGANCPNALPSITWNTPSSTTINQPTFQVVPISVTVVDSDGSISGVTITINGGTFAMTSGANGTYTYNFTPSAYQDYPIVIKATDNRAGVTTLNNTIKITSVSNRFNPLPTKVIMGYAHGFSNGAPNLKFSDIANTKYNVIQYAFIETVNRDGYTPTLTVNEGLYMTNGSYNPQLLKDDIRAFRASGKPVIASIGGQNGHVVLETIAQKNAFVAGIKNLVDQYGFDGIDLDFEGGSMNFNAGSLRDISYAGISAYPRLKNIVDACKELKAYYGSGFLLTAAPETQYVQGGYSNYSDTYGSFLPVIQNLRNELDLLAVQLYNTGGENGLDGRYYGSGAGADMLTALTDMLIKGYKIGASGMYFDGLPASKILFGLPCNASAAGSGYKAPPVVINALNYLRFGTTFSGRIYTLQPGGPYPSLRGVMTWSINWDASTSYEFVNAYYPYFFGAAASSAKTSEKATVYLSENTLHVKSNTVAIQQVKVYNLFGQLLVNQRNSDTNKESTIAVNLAKEKIYIVEIIDIDGNIQRQKVY